MVLLIKSTTPMKLQLLPSTQEETTQIHPWLKMMTSVFKTQQLLHSLSPSKLL
jgi:hypothetical protein